MKRIISCFLILIFVYFLFPGANAFSTRIFFLRNSQKEAEKSRSSGVALMKAVSPVVKSKKILKKKGRKKKVKDLTKEDDKKIIEEEKIDQIIENEDVENIIYSDESETEEVSYENVQYPDNIECNLNEFFNLFLKDKIENCEEKWKDFIELLFLKGKIYGKPYSLDREVKKVVLNIEDTKVNVNEALALLEDFLKER